jgi:pseudaminic acid synthase
MSPPRIQIADRFVGRGYPCYMVAEMSANHGHKLEHALRILEAAKQAGADAVKVQTYTPDTITLDCRTDVFKVHAGSLWSGQYLYDLYKEAYTPWEWHETLQRAARKLGLEFFSTPFDESAVDFLEELGVPAYKIASFELIDHGLIKRVAKTSKPLLLSTGMATKEEIREAVTAYYDAGGSELILLKCTSAYPAPPQDANLRTIEDLSSSFNVPVGLSDHTQELVVPVTAVAMGAVLIEKHFTLARAEGGPDATFSLEPQEFRQMVNAVRMAEAAAGAVAYAPTEKEALNKAFRRSLFVVADIAAGALLTTDNVRSIRPSAGLEPKYLPQILGRKAARDIQRGTPLDWSLIK